MSGNGRLSECVAESPASPCPPNRFHSPSAMQCPFLPSICRIMRILLTCFPITACLLNVHLEKLADVVKLMRYELADAPDLGRD